MSKPLNNLDDTDFDVLLDLKDDPFLDLPSSPTRDALLESLTSDFGISPTELAQIEEEELEDATSESESCEEDDEELDDILDNSPRNQPPQPPPLPTHLRTTTSAPLPRPMQPTTIPSAFAPFAFTPGPSPLPTPQVVLPSMSAMSPQVVQMPGTPGVQPQGVQIPPGMIYPFVPFWSACPLPFSPYAYPQTIIPRTQEIPITPPSMNPRAKKIAEWQAKKERQAKNPKGNLDSRNKSSQRVRDASGRFAKTDHLKNQLEELKSQLANRESESRMLRERLNSTERELLVFKQLARQSQDEDAFSPSEIDNGSTSPTKVASDIFNNSSPFKARTPQSNEVEAFKHKIDFSQIELRKTSPPPSSRRNVLAPVVEQPFTGVELRKTPADERRVQDLNNAPKPDFSNFALRKTNSSKTVLEPQPPQFSQVELRKTHLSFVDDDKRQYLEAQQKWHDDHSQVYTSMPIFPSRP